MAKKPLTSEQINILSSCTAGAKLAADIAHAMVTIYLRDEDHKNIFVQEQVQPLTQIMHKQTLFQGRLIKLNEEPLIARVLQREIMVMGKREWTLGNFVQIKIFPLFDSRRNCFGAVAFETVAGAIGDGTTDTFFIDIAMNFLKGLDAKLLTTANYRRLNSTDGIMIVNQDKVIVAADNTAQHIFSVLGVPNIIGRRTNSLQINWPLVGMVLKAGIAESKEITLQGLILAMRILPLTSKPDTEAAIVILADITELKKKDEELLIKSVVIKEIHHRVKNNLQTITSLLRLQARRTESEEAKIVLKDCINRVNSIAVVHEFLSQQDSGEIDVAQVAKEIYEAILISMVTPELELTTSFQADNILLPSEQATALALVLNELLQNALEHGFKNRVQGKLEVKFARENGFYILEIIDDGVGIAADFQIGLSKSLGLKIIQTMVEADLGGRFAFIPVKKGTCARVTVPIGEEK